MKARKYQLLTLAFLVAAALAGMLIAGRKADQAVAREQNRPATASIPPSPISELPPAAETPKNQSQPQIQPAQADVQPVATPEKKATQVAKAGKGKEPIQDPAARAALSFVGADPDAEAYWMGAINDPNLPAEERKDLIEDLNEDGLSNPKHPGPEDLPLILNRLQLIEELAPDAMDRVNADAFAEAYKDLNNMLAGKPVQ